MELYYKDVDILSQVQVLRCELKQNLFDELNTLTITFNDKENKWSKWRPQPEDKLRVTEDFLKSGNMYVYAVKPKSGMMTLKAASVKYLQDCHKQEWTDIGLKELIDLRANDLGLKTEYYGFQNQTYKSVKQDGSDLVFLAERCQLEGCGFMVEDGILRVISYDYLKEIPTANTTLEAFDSRVEDKSFYAGCKVSDGTITGKAGNENGEVLIADTACELDSIQQANRFASNMLKYGNFGRKMGVMYSDSLLSQFAPGSKIYINCGYWENIPVIISKARHDLYNMKSKLWFVRMED